MNLLKISAILSATLLLASCASTPSGAPWVEPVTNKRAAFLWKHSRGTMSGDAIMTYDMAGNVMVRLLKNVPQPLLETTSTSDGRFFAAGPMAAGGWSGRASNVPMRFSLWNAIAEAWRGSLSARDGRQEVHTASYRAAVWKENGRIRELSVSSTDNGEVIRLVFEG